MSGEQALHTTRAHLFQIDPVTKKTWKPLFAQPVPISLYHDPERGLYRVVSLDPQGAALINSTLLHNTAFAKTSPKFGQWADPKNATMFGLGFPTEADMQKFSEVFEEAVAVLAARKKEAPPSAGKDKEKDKKEADKAEKKEADKVEAKDKSAPKVAPKPKDGKKEDGAAGKNGEAGPEATDELTVLKYENERLKAALAASSTNAKKWETELQTAKNNNARLTTALQDSAKNVEEWKKQLAVWKDESTKTKKKIQEAEAAMEEAKKKEAEAVEQLAQFKTTFDEQQKEMATLKEQLAEAQAQAQAAKSKVAELEAGLEDMEKVCKELEQAASFEGKYRRFKEDMRAWQSTLAMKIADLDDLHSAFGSLVDSDR